MCGQDRSGKKWYQNKKGKLRLLQAMNHRVENQTKNLDRSEYIDFDWAPMLKKAGSVLDEFRTGTKATLKRTTFFLVQVLIRIICDYHPSEELKVLYGTGYQAAPRMGLWFLLENEINDRMWSRLCDVARMLFMKAREEGANTKALTEVLNNEWEVDRRKEAAVALNRMITQGVVPGVLDGRLPRLNLNWSLDNQYDHCSKDTDSQ
jgi:hypothetical protein